MSDQDSLLHVSAMLLFLFPRDWYLHLHLPSKKIECQYLEQQDVITWRLQLDADIPPASEQTPVPHAPFLGAIELVECFVTPHEASYCLVALLSSCTS